MVGHCSSGEDQGFVEDGRRCSCKYEQRAEDTASQNPQTGNHSLHLKFLLTPASELAWHSQSRKPHSIQAATVHTQTLQLDAVAV